MTSMSSPTGTEPKTPLAILIGLDSTQGLQVARILNDRGVTVLGIASNIDYHTTATNACAAVIQADTGPEGLIDVLHAMAPHFTEAPVLIPCQDKNVLALSEHRAELADQYRFVLPPDDVVRQMADKTAMVDVASAHGFRVPDSYVLRTRGDAVRAAENIRYPAILKPYRGVGSWTRHTAEKAFMVNDADDLMSRYDVCRSWAEPLIVQQWVDGDDTSLLTCNVYYDRSGDRLASFVTRKIRQWPPQTGKGSAGTETQDDEAQKEAHRFFEAIGLRGLGYVEFKRSQTTGELYLIEPNIGRPTGRSATAEAGGVELHYTMYCDAAGLSLPDNRSQTQLGATWVNVIRDVQAALHQGRRGDLTPRQWITSLQGPRAYAIWSLNDPAPFAHALSAAVRRLSKRDGADGNQAKQLQTEMEAAADG